MHQAACPGRNTLPMAKYSTVREWVWGGRVGWGGGQQIEEPEVPKCMQGSGVLEGTGSWYAGHLPP